jgi:hypothetical protein
MSGGAGSTSELNQTDAMPAQEPALWKPHRMELLGPPLNLD